MTFGQWYTMFQGFGDDRIQSLGVSPAQLNDWKTFVQDYRRAHPGYVSTQEMVAAYYATFPNQRPIAELTVEQFKAL